MAQAIRLERNGKVDPANPPAVGAPTLPCSAPVVEKTKDPRPRPPGRGPRSVPPVAKPVARAVQLPPISALLAMLPPAQVPFKAPMTQPLHVPPSVGVSETSVPSAQTTSGLASSAVLTERTICETPNPPMPDLQVESLREDVSRLRIASPEADIIMPAAVSPAPGPSVVAEFFQSFPLKLDEDSLKKLEGLGARSAFGFGQLCRMALRTPEGMRSAVQGADILPLHAAYIVETLVRNKDIAHSLIQRHSA